MQLPPSKDFFPGGVAGVGGVCRKGKVAGGCVMMSVMLMWVLHAKSKLVLASRSLISQ